MLAFLLRRLFFAAGTLVLTAFFAYGIIRLLRPELYPGEATLGGLWSDVTGALLHLDLGESCMFFGCPPLKRMWLDGIWADLFLLAGGVAVVIALGLLGGAWCAARPRSLGTRAIEAVAMVFFCSPAYVVGFLSLLLFAPPFGLVQLPLFFEHVPHHVHLTDGVFRVGEGPLGEDLLRAENGLVLHAAQDMPAQERRRPASAGLLLGEAIALSY